MKREEAKRKMNFLKEAYQKLIDEGVDNGTVVGTGVRGTWKSDTTLTKAYEDMIDACDVAIEALEQEPCADCISRQAVIKAIEEVGLLTCEYIDVKQAIESLPSVNPTSNVSIQITEREKYGRFN